MYKITNITLNNQSLDLTGQSVLSSAAVHNLFSALTNITSTLPTPSISITFTLPNSQQILLAKQDSLLTINSNPVTDLWNELQTLLGQEDFSIYDLLASFNNLDLSPLVLQSLIRSFVEVDMGAQLTPEKIQQHLQKYNNPDITEYVETYLKIQQAQGKLDKQKLLDESTQLLEETLQQVTSLNQQKQNVTSIISILTSVEQKLSAYEAINKPTLEQDALRFKQDIMAIRQESLLQNSKQLPINTLGKEEVKLPKLNNYKIGLIVVAWQTVLTLFTVFITNNLWFLIPSVLIISFTGLLAYISKFINPVITITNNAIIKAPANTNQQASINKKLDFLERFFIQKAWLNALKQEVNSLSQQINNKLDGVDYNQLLVSINQLFNLASNLAYLASANKNLDLTPSEFLRTRQELDNLKQRLLTLEQVISDLNEYGDVLSLCTQLSFNTEPIPLNLPAELLGEEYTSLYISEANLIGKLNDQGELQEVSLQHAELLNIYMWLRLVAIEYKTNKESLSPYIFILPAKLVPSLSITIKNQIAKLVAELNQLLIWQVS